MSGDPRAIDQGTRLLARGGRMSLLGLPEGPVALDLTDQVIFKEARLLGITGREMFRTWQQTQTMLASGMVDGARLSRARIEVYPHRDVSAADRLLEETRGARRQLLITDGVFSMDGD